MEHFSEKITDTIFMDFFRHVKDEISKQNTTQEWVAQQSGISFSTFRGWMTKQRLPNVDQAVAIAKALGVSVEYLVNGEEKKVSGLPLGTSKEVQDLVNIASKLPENRQKDLLQMAETWYAAEVSTNEKKGLA